MLQATANFPCALLSKGILFLMKLQTSIRHPFLHRQSGCQKGQLKSAKNTWDYKNITPFRNTMAESLRVSFLSIADKQSEQSSNKGTRLGSGIRTQCSKQWKIQIRSSLALTTASCSRDKFCSVGACHPPRYTPIRESYCSNRQITICFKK